ncbi:lantibiotic dehydratase [Amycolatopsis sp. NBC_00345]|uniref:lantibiotic dehydratase n=1 Tax=Amycolatopsis sp. NBC_00345 TaxID=2975955 RepID=UPI002E26D147
MPAETARRLFSDPGSGDEARLWDQVGDPLVRAALTVASADLVDALDRNAQGQVAATRRRRLRSGLLRYLIRMSTRATPFGLFAAVSWGEFGDHCTAVIDGGLKRHTRADLGWLLDVIEAVESDAAVLPFLRLTANPLAYLVGERLVLRPADVYGKDDLRGVSLRATEVVRHLLDEAVTPVPYGELVERVVAEFPGVPGDRVEALVGRLHELRFLITDLRPPLNQPRPERHVIDVLAHVPPARAAYEALLRVSTLMARCDEDLLSPSAPMRELLSAQRELLPDGSGRTCQVDAALSIPGCTVPAEVGVEVAEAVTWLGRVMGPAPRFPHLTDYRAAFTERYGREGLVPLTDLLSPEHGLGSPSGYLNPGGAQMFAVPNRAAPDLERPYALPLLAEALRTGQLEVDLADPRLAELIPEKPDDGRDRRPPAPGLDVTVQIAAASADAIPRGEWNAVLPPGSFAPAGRTVGRFVHLLPRSAEGQVRDHLLAQDTAADPDVVHAELSYLPVQGRAANVTVHPIMRSHEIPVNVTPSVAADRVIPLRDIVIGLDGDRFAAYSERLGRRIRIHQGHMLNPQSAPDVCRFLLESAQDGDAAPARFDWGTAETAPFLPRVRRGRIVLRLAQWNIRVPGTFGRAALDSDEALAEAVRAWRSTWQVPRWVYLADQDRRLLLDLDHPLSTTELRAELGRTAERGRTWLPLQEMYPGFDDLWVSGADGRRHVSEVVIPLTARSAPRPPAPEVPRAALSVGRRPRRHLPGGTWLSMKLYTTETAMEGIVSRMWSKPAVCPDEEWFYLRYADPAPHLRIRVRTGLGDMGALFAGWTEWARGLVGEGLAADLVLNTYSPELIRYGGPDTMAAVERVFCASSAATARFLAEPGPDDLPRLVVAAYAVECVYRDWGFDLDQRLARASSLPRPSEENDPARPDRRLLADLLAPEVPPGSPIAKMRADLAAVFGTQAAPLAEAGALARAAAGEGTLTTAEHTVVDGIAHLQVNRLLGTDHDLELACHRLWSHALRTIRSRWPG